MTELMEAARVLGVGSLADPLGSDVCSSDLEGLEPSTSAL